MRIRRKLPKASRLSSPAYVVGYTGSPPSPEALRQWFDLEYGGPLSLRALSGQASAPTAPLHAVHGPWHATLQILLPAEEAETWKDVLAWGHEQAGQVLAAPTAPGKAIDLALHAARLARGLTLLTQGTAYDVATDTYLNPSDWTDRSLERFLPADHVTVQQGEASEGGRERFATRGLTKFGLDELETFRPVGLSSRRVLEELAGIGGEIVQMGRVPAVGATIELPALGLTVQVLRHHTAPAAGRPVPYREITWEESRP